MTKNEFQFHLAGASIQAYRFAMKFVNNKLPIEFRFVLELNVSSDEKAHDKFDIYPNDNGKISSEISETEVVELLYRKGKIPVWIDINVYKADNKSTTFKLLCAGRYTNIKKDYYYNHNGSGPFGIKSPILPPNYVEGTKFEI